MFNDLIGWDGSTVGNFGTYYYKNGRLTNGLNPPQQLNTCIMRLGEGYDIALMANSEGPLDVTTQVVNAFEARGVPLSAEPGNAPYIISVVQGASFLPNCAPGGYVSIIGAGFQGPAVNWAPTTTLPAELNQIKVRVGSQYAYVAYAGPGQVNFLLPFSVPTGIQNVELTMPGGGVQSSIQINPIAPGLFAYKLNGKSYPVALFAGGSVIAAAVGALSGSTSRPAKAGDILEFFGTGMGPTNPPAPDGVSRGKPGGIPNDHRRQGCHGKFRGTGGCGVVPTQRSGSHRCEWGRPAGSPDGQRDRDPAEPFVDDRSSVIPRQA